MKSICVILFNRASITKLILMQLKSLIVSSIIAIPCFLLLYSFTEERESSQKPEFKSSPLIKTDTAKIQVAILLDVSGSMSGLLEQAKAQLWNMVTVMGRAKCNSITPNIEIALYEYGRNDNGKNGYIKQLSPFTTNLDKLSEILFSLQTTGSIEYCGEVISKSVDELNWDKSSASYKVIFIAGNEDFLQGTVHYKTSCAKAMEKGIIVNTIYCGDRFMGIKEHWDLGADCGKGSYTFINQQLDKQDIPTPYDDQLITLNQQLNLTYIGYGADGSSRLASMETADNLNYQKSKSVAVKRVTVKGNNKLYKNTSWDLVDASANDSLFYKKVETKNLPVELQSKSKEELNVYIKQKTTERNILQKQIAQSAMKRDSFLLQSKKEDLKGDQFTLESEIEKIIIEQAKRYNMKFE